MANKMMNKSKSSKKLPGKVDFGPKAGPNMMPHTGKKDCRCPNCKDKRK